MSPPRLLQRLGREQAAMGSLLLRLLAVALQLGTAVLCGQVGGAAAVGVLGGLQGWSRTSALALVLGGSTSAVREFAPLGRGLSQASVDSWFRGSLLRAIRIAAVAAALVGAAALLLAPSRALVTLVAIGCAVFIATARLAAVPDQCRGRAVPLILADFTLPAGFTLVALATLALFVSISSRAVGVAVAVGFGASALVSLRRLRSMRRALADGERQAAVDAALDVRAGVPVTVAELAIMALPLVPYLLFGLESGHADDAGYYAIATRVAGLAAVILTAIGVASVARLAIAAQARNERELRQVLWWSTRVGTLLYLPLLVPCVLWPGFVVGLFGAHGRTPELVLIVVVVGQLGNTLTGVGMHALLMLGRQRTAALNSVIGLVVALVGAALTVGHSVVVMTAVVSAALALKNLLDLVHALRATRGWDPTPQLSVA